MTITCLNLKSFKYLFTTGFWCSRGYEALKPRGIIAIGVLIIIFNAVPQVMVTV